MAGRGSSPVLVGRAEEMAALADALSGAREGGHPALLIGGEAGAGKSRLLAEFAVAVPEARVLTGGCLQLGGDELPFTPFATVLRGLVRELGADAVTAMMPGRGIPELARLIPELGEPDEGRDPGEARARLFEEMLTLLGRLAESGPVIMLVEDAHWAESLRDLLLGTVQRLPDATREVLRVASTGIEPYGHGLLAVASGLDEEEALAALRPAVMANVLLASADGYSFRHALIREAVSGDLLPGEDERQHARYAAAIDANPSLAGPGRWG